ncbi:phosphotransferase family protein [Nonomuraea sp. NPDC050783]|uniref:phosphotransferase family protein n=1 Tax=Nonomuraea sp. NPDC050783 TaxID=3154634 RepID=UPI0034679808
MRSEEIRRVAGALDAEVTAVRTLAGGFSHETCLLTLAGAASGRESVVARLGGERPGVEAAVMARARAHVPVPAVLRVLPASDGCRPVMLLEYVPGTPLSHVLEVGRHGPREPRKPHDLHGLGVEVGRVVAAVGAVTFDRPGFFGGEGLAAGTEQPWSAQLPGFAAACMAAEPVQERLDAATRREWAALCAAHAPALARVDRHSRLAHADVNPKNILVSPVAGGGWRVDALLDWEFAYSGCPYGDAANMLRFGADYPAPFVAGFRAGFAAHQPAGAPLDRDWAYLGRVLDMFALSDLVTRPRRNAVVDRAAEEIRRWTAGGLPDAPDGAGSGR